MPDDRLPPADEPPEPAVRAEPGRGEPPGARRTTPTSRPERRGARRAAARSTCSSRRASSPPRRARPRAAPAPIRRPTGRRGADGRARGDPGVPAGDARARPALVRAEAAARLRLLTVPRAQPPLTWLDVFTVTPLAGNGLAVVHDADGARRRDDARVRARDAAVRDDVRAVADRRRRRLPQPHLDDRRELPFAGHPSLGTAVAVARAARRERGCATCSRRTERHEQALSTMLDQVVAWGHALKSVREPVTV